MRGLGFDSPTRRNLFFSFVNRSLLASNWSAKNPRGRVCSSFLEEESVPRTSASEALAVTTIVEESDEEVSIDATDESRV